jgi:hypothetical protein
MRRLLHALRAVTHRGHGYRSFLRSIFAGSPATVAENPDLLFGLRALYVSIYRRNETLRTQLLSGHGLRYDKGRESAPSAAQLSTSVGMQHSQVWVIEKGDTSRSTSVRADERGTTSTVKHASAKRKQDQK